MSEQRDGCLAAVDAYNSKGTFDVLVALMGDLVILHASTGAEQCPTLVARTTVASSLPGTEGTRLSAPEVSGRQHRGGPSAAVLADVDRWPTIKGGGGSAPARYRRIAAAAAAGDRVVVENLWRGDCYAVP